MYNRTRCEDIIQIENFVSVIFIFIYYFNFATFIYLHCFELKHFLKNPSKKTRKKYNEWLEKLIGQSS